MTAAGLVLARAFADVCRFRLAPQQLPASPALLLVALAAYALSGAAGAAIELPPSRALLASVLDTALLAAFTAGVLMLRGVAGRLTQTLTALTGAQAVLGVAGIPVLLWLHAARGSAAELVPSVAWLALFVWSLLVFAHVLRHALSTHPLVGFVLALAYVALSVHLLAPVVAPQPTAG